MGKRIGKTILWLGLLLILGGRPAFAQSGNKVRLSVNESNYPEIGLAVGIRDSTTGKPVYGLKKKDFTILEKGDPQKITSFLAIEKKGSDVLDVVFLFDQTGSMGDEITAVRNNAMLFSDILKKSAVDYRLALITFSDKIEKSFDFTSDIETFKEQVASISAVGGGDAPENALEALGRASELPFRKDAGIAFILITDAPYHENDRYTDLAMKPLVKRLALKDISVFPIAVKLNEYIRMAKETNGTFFNILSDFSSIIEELAHGLTSQYKLRYITSHPCPDGAQMDLELQISPLSASADGRYKRPLNYKQLDLDISYASETISIVPQNPVECDTVSFQVPIQAKSCSDFAELQDVVVRLYDVKGERTEVACSEPVTLLSNGDPRDIVIQWNTTGYRGRRDIEFIIEPGDDVLERSQENNIIRRTVPLNEVAHDLYIESIDYSPNPPAPCDVIKLTVNIDDGTRCRGLTLHDIEVEGFENGQSLGRIVTSVTVGTPGAVVFESDAGGSVQPRRFRFVVDPDRAFGTELMRDNNVGEVLIRVNPVQHDLSVENVSHEPERAMVGDTLIFHTRVSDTAHCPEVPLGQDIRLRLANAADHIVLAQSEPFTLSTGNNIVVPIKWTTRLRHHGPREVQIAVDPRRRIRERTPPGSENNSVTYTVDILPMPHDLVIESAAVTPESPGDGDPASIRVTVYDNARFPGVKLENVNVKVFERYSRVLLGESGPTFVHSLQRRNIDFQIDTGGLAGERELMLVVDPDKKIEELTPDKLDGENNNRYFLEVTIHE